MQVQLSCIQAMQFPGQCIACIMDIHSIDQIGPHGAIFTARLQHDLIGVFLALSGNKSCFVDLIRIKALGILALKAAQRTQKTLY